MPGNKKLIMLALMIGTFLTAIEGTVVSTALPKITSELQGIERMNWVFSVYLLSSTTMVPIFGRLADLFGRKNIFVVGTCIFLAGTTLCGLASSMQFLILCRAIQGIGAGAILPLANTVIGDIFPMEERAKMLGLIASVWGVAGIIGPLVGGFLVDQISWRWIFWINLPLGIIAIWLFCFSWQENEPKQKRSIDYWGAFTFVLALFSLLAAIQLGGELNQWTSPLVLTLLSVFGLFFILFIYIENRVNEPMLPLHLFRVRNFSVPSLLGFMISIIYIGTMVYLPVWAQAVLGLSATQSGFLITPMMLTWILGSYVSGKLIAQYGAQKTGFIGVSSLLLTSIGLCMLETTTPVIYIYMITSVQGFGFGLVLTLCTLTVQSVDWTLRGVATASNVFFRSLGQAAGSSLLGTYFYVHILTYMQERLIEPIDVWMEKLNTQLSAGTMEVSAFEHAGLIQELLMSALHDLFFVFVILALLALLVTLLMAPKFHSAD